MIINDLQNLMESKNHFTVFTELLEITDETEIKDSLEFLDKQYFSNPYIYLIQFLDGSWGNRQQDIFDSKFLESCLKSPNSAMMNFEALSFSVLLNYGELSDSEKRLEDYLNCKEFIRKTILNSKFFNDVAEVNQVQEFLKFISRTIKEFDINIDNESERNLLDLNLPVQVIDCLTEFKRINLMNPFSVRTTDTRKLLKMKVLEVVKKNLKNSDRDTVVGFLDNNLNSVSYFFAKYQIEQDFVNSMQGFKSDHSLGVNLYNALIQMPLEERFCVVSIQPTDGNFLAPISAMVNDKETGKTELIYFNLDTRYKPNTSTYHRASSQAFNTSLKNYIAEALIADLVDSVQVEKVTLDSDKCLTVSSHISEFGIEIRTNHVLDSTGSMTNNGLHKIYCNGDVLTLNDLTAILSNKMRMKNTFDVSSFLSNISTKHQTEVERFI